MYKLFTTEAEVITHEEINKQLRKVSIFKMKEIYISKQIAIKVHNKRIDEQEREKYQILNIIRNL